MKKEIKIKQCYQTCPFFGLSMGDMECNHPYWEDRGAYKNMIITQENSQGRIPEKCPLRNEQLIITYELL